MEISDKIKENEIKENKDTKLSKLKKTFQVLKRSEKFIKGVKIICVISGTIALAYTFYKILGNSNQNVQTSNNLTEVINIGAGGIGMAIKNFNENFNETEKTDITVMNTKQYNMILDMTSNMIEEVGFNLIKKSIFDTVYDIVKEKIKEDDIISILNDMLNDSFSKVNFKHLRYNNIYDEILIIFKDTIDNPKFMNKIKKIVDKAFEEIDIGSVLNNQIKNTLYDKTFTIVESILNDKTIKSVKTNKTISLENDTQMYNNTYNIVENNETKMLTDEIVDKIINIKQEDLTNIRENALSDVMMRRTTELLEEEKVIEFISTRLQECILKSMEAETVKIKDKINYKII